MGQVVVTRSPALVRYVVAQDVTVTVSVYDDDGDLADPSGGVTLTTTHPEGADTEESLTNDSTGVYSAVVTLDADGRWKFHAQSAGDIVAADKLSISVEDRGIAELPADEEIPLVPVPSAEGSHAYRDEDGWTAHEGDIEPDLDYTGVADGTTELQRALDAADYGQTVRTRRGKVRLDGPITIPNGVTLRGPDIGHQFGPFINNNAMAAAGYSGTTFNIYHTGVAFTLSQESTFRDAILFYPTQNRTSAPTVFDYAIDVPAGENHATIKYIVGVNPYRFVSVGADGPVGGVTIERLRGTALRRGIYLGRVSDVARVHDVHLNRGGHYGFNSTLTDWIQANCDAFVVDGPEEAHFTGCFAYGVANGYLFQDIDLDGFRGVYGSAQGGGIDHGNACVHVVEPNGLTVRGFKFSSMGLIPTDSLANGVLFEDTHTAAGSDERPRVALVECEFHNAHSRTVYLLSGSYGFVELLGCYSAGATNAVLVNSSSTGIVNSYGLTTLSGTNRTAGTDLVVDKGGIVLGGSTGSDRNGGARQTVASAAAISAVNIYPGDGRAPKGKYRLYYTIIVTAAESGGSHTVTPSVDYDDALGSPNAAGTAVALSATGRTHGHIDFTTDGAHGPQWKTTIGGAAGTGTPSYTIDIQVERL